MPRKALGADPRRFGAHDATTRRSKADRRVGRLPASLLSVGAKLLVGRARPGTARRRRRAYDQLAMVVALELPTGVALEETHQLVVGDRSAKFPGCRRHSLSPRVV